MTTPYRMACNLHGLRALSTDLCIPDLRLGVGIGENLSPQHMKVEYQTKQHYVVTPFVDKYSYEELQVNLNSVPLTDESFPQTFYFGELVKGVQ